MVRSVDIAWAAGLFEGEGTIGFNLGRYGTRVRIVPCIQMTDRDVIEKLKLVLKVGTVHGPYLSKNAPKHHIPCFRWQIGRQSDAIGFLMTILPLLGERRRQRAEDAIAAWRAIPVYDPHGPRRQGGPA